MISYTVRCEITDSEVAENWLRWLRDQHISDVVSAGAKCGDVFEMDHDSKARLFEIRYQFENRASFEKYVSEHAPRLREEGLEKFPLELGLSYSRSSGELI